MYTNKKEKLKLEIKFSLYLLPESNRGKGREGGGKPNKFYHTNRIVDF
jgi:hypothetical protein